MPGEDIALWAREDTPVGDLSYRVFQHVFTAEEDFYQYVQDGLGESETILAAAAMDTASAVFLSDTIEADSTWRSLFQVVSPVATGAVILEFRTSGGAVVESISPAADTYISGDTLAASYIGAGGTSVIFTLSGRGHGSVSLFRIRGTDRNGGILEFEFPAPQTVQIVPVPVPVVDLDGDGTLSASDVRVLLIALIQDRESEYPQADIWPYPGGDGKVDVVDFHYLNVAAVTGRWPDGRVVQ